MRKLQFKHNGTTYTRISRKEAKKLWGHETIVVYPSNVNDYHILGGWQLGSTINPETAKVLPQHDEKDFIEGFCKTKLFYTEPELGRYLCFLKKVT